MRYTVGNIVLTENNGIGDERLDSCTLLCVLTFLGDCYLFLKIECVPVMRFSMKTLKIAPK